MKFTIDSRLFVNGIQFVGINERSTNTESPTEEQVEITITTNKLQMRTQGTAVEKTSAWLNCVADVSEPVTITVEHQKLFDIVSSLSKRYAEIELSELKKEIQLKSGKTKSKLRKFEGVIPKRIENDVKSVFVVKRVELIKALKTAKVTSGKNDVRHFLNGAFISYDNDGFIRVVSTDGHRLSASKMLVEHSENFEGKGIIVTNRGLDYLLSYLHLCAEESVKIELDDDFCQCSINTGVSVKVRLVDGEYPDWRRIIPNGARHLAVVRRLELLSSMDSAITFCSDKRVNTKFVIEGSSLSLTNKSDDGEYADTIEVGGHDAPEKLEAGYNVHYLKDALQELSDPLVMMCVDNDSTPMVITGNESQSCLMLVMPTRI
ncbi:DNA polymerase III subunit beta [Vibrio tritonius]|uniref:Beta sliding clamp n=1 Tax=Vibrio tritonius TaxID=1435069 RepID=A0ABS7YG79_9VIBR|nr:DNA polymerase III subunit beta [Vibrio tritonius]MCA2014673.1 DNA polymerase III subunit beta [Vibrio tritonius]